MMISKNGNLGLPNHLSILRQPLLAVEANDTKYRQADQQMQRLRERLRERQRERRGRKGGRPEDIHPLRPWMMWMKAEPLLEVPVIYTSYITLLA